MPPRDQQPGYAATLMGDDAMKIIKPLETALMLSAGINMLQTFGMDLGMNPGGPANLLSSTTLTAPVLKSAVSAVAGPTVNPFAAGPKLFGGLKL